MLFAVKLPAISLKWTKFKDYQFKYIIKEGADHVLVHKFKHNLQTVPNVCSYLIISDIDVQTRLSRRHQYLDINVFVCTTKSLSDMFVYCSLVTTHGICHSMHHHHNKNIIRDHTCYRFYNTRPIHACYSLLWYRLNSGVPQSYSLYYLWQILV